MGKKIQILIYMGILTGLLFACASSSENDRKRQEKTASGGGASEQAAVSGNVTGTMANEAEGTASGGVVRDTDTDAGEKKYRFCNDNYLYYKSTEKDSLTERNLSDGSEREIRIGNYQALCYVDNDQIYYLKKKREEGEVAFQSELWRAPVEDGKMNVKKAELVFTEKLGIDSAYIHCDGRYLVYIAGVFSEFKFTSYDLQRKKVLWQGEAAALYGMAGGAAFFYDEDIMRQNLDSLYPMDEPSEEDMYVSEERDGIITMTDTDIFYAAEEYSEDYSENIAIIQNHIKDSTTKVIITHGQIKRSLIEEGFIDRGQEEHYVYYPERIFVSGNRLYVQMDISWSRDKVVCWNKAVFSQEIGAEGKLHYEKGLTTCLANPKKDQKVFKKITDERDEEGMDTLYLSRGGCLYMIEGKCFMYLYDSGKGRNRVACYDLASGKFTFLTEKDADWYLPYYDGAIPYWKAFVSRQEIGMDMPNNKDVNWPYW